MEIVLFFFKFGGQNLESRDRNVGKQFPGLN